MGKDAIQTDFLKRARKQRNLTISKLSHSSGVSSSHISRIESGDRAASPDVLRKLAAGLGVSYISLLIEANVLSHSDLQEYQATASMG